jgi:hypothetical protein
MPRKKKTTLTRSTGVVLEIPVIEYLDRLVLAGKARDRSEVLNIVIRDHAKHGGEVLPSAKIEGHQPQFNLKT